MQKLTDLFNSSKAVIAPRRGTSRKKIIPSEWVSRILACLFIGLILAYVTSLFLTGFLLNKTAESKKNFAELVGKRPASVSKMNSLPKDNIDGLPNAFNVATRKTMSPNEGPSSLSSFHLVGTLPGVAAWIKVGDTTQLVLLGKELQSYKLSSVDAGEILLTRNGENTPLYLIFSTESVKPSPPPSSPPVDSTSSTGQIKVANPNAEEGQVSRELINKLMNDPYKELANIRMVPNPDGTGMNIMRISDSSIFAQMGLKEGDVLKGFNNVNINNAQNMSNAVSSMLTSDRMDITIMRDGVETQLKYAVR